MVIDSVGYGLLLYSQFALEREEHKGSHFTSNLEKFAVSFSLVSLLAVTLYCAVEATIRIQHPETHVQLLNGKAVLVLSLVSPKTF